MFTFLILFSVAFTHMFTEKVLLYVFCILIITINNLGVEYFLIKKIDSTPKNYIGKFILICLPFALIVLGLFYSI